MTIEKRIAFASFNVKKGTGGHYHSLLQTARSELFENAHILDVGYESSPVLRDDSDQFIRFNALRSPLVVKEIYNFLRHRRIELVMCYDRHAYTICALACRALGIPQIYIKCAGPEFAGYIPLADYVIGFSEEDRRFLRKHLPNAEVEIIPNRVSEARLQECQIKRGGLRFTSGARVACIARIGHSYRKKIDLALNLVTLLREEEEASLVVIGTVEHPEVLAELRSQAPEYVHFITDDQQTRRAAMLLSNFDAAVATGRGACESALLGLQTYVPVNNSTGLVLLTPQNYELLKETNFSGRATVAAQDLFAISEKNLGPKARAELAEKVRKDFAIECAAVRYENYFENLSAKKRRGWILNHLIGWVYLFYSSMRERNALFRRYIYPFLKRW